MRCWNIRRPWFATCIMFYQISRILGTFNFNGHKVLRIIPKSADELDNILILHKLYDLDIWRHPRSGNHSHDVLVEEDKLGKILQELEKLGTEVKIMINDVQTLINEERSSINQNIFNSSDTSHQRFNHFTYNRYTEIKQYLYDVMTATTTMQDITATVINMGYSVEGREINVLKISRKNGKKRPSIFIDGGIHAREWITTATVLYFINMLVFDKKSSVLLEKFDWHIAPLLNPDGYEYSHTKNRLWRKNRNPHNKECIGTDLNRNFGFKWQPTFGGRSNMCSGVYAGKGPFSEKETQAFKNYILNNNKHMLAYVTYHSYGQLWLFPWGYTTRLPIDWKELERAATVGTLGLKSLYGTKYTVGSSSNILYTASGVSDDWMKAVVGVKYAYTIELRDTGKYGFILPADQIEPTCKESWRGLVDFALSLNTFYL